MWAAEHGDINLITMLPRATAPGLQVRTDRGWVDATPPEGSAIINTGMMLDHLTNGVIGAGIHRVVAAEGQTGDRYSVVQFAHPTPWTILTPLPTCVTDDNPLRYPSISAADALAKVIWGDQPGRGRPPHRSRLGTTPPAQCARGRPRRGRAPAHRRLVRLGDAVLVLLLSWSSRSCRAATGSSCQGASRHSASMGAEYRRSPTLSLRDPVCSSTPARKVVGDTASRWSRSHARCLRWSGPGDAVAVAGRRASASTFMRAAARPGSAR